MAWQRRYDMLKLIRNWLASIESGLEEEVAFLQGLNQEERLSLEMFRAQRRCTKDLSLW